MLNKKKLSLLFIAITCGSVAFANQPSGISATQTTIQEPLSRQGVPLSKQPIVKTEAAEVLLTYQLVQTLSKTTIEKSRGLEWLQLRQNQIILPDGSPLADHVSLQVSQDAWLYRITYSSRDLKERPTTLSGLVVVPMLKDGRPGDARGGLVVYTHGTTAQRSNAPGDRSMEAYGAITNFAGENWVLAMPDYLGYGANRQPHPYALAKLNAESGLDMITATKELLGYLKFPKARVGKQINVTGYSEGGGNAMGLGLFLNAGWAQGAPLKIAPMSGPYDLSGATAQSFIAEQPSAITSVENTEEKPTLLSFSGVATSQVLGQPTWKMLLDPIAQQSKGMFPGSYADSDVGARILTTAINDLDYLESTTPRPDRLLQPQVVQAIKSNDLNYPPMKLWAENNTVDWGLAPDPQTQVYMIGVIQDALVPFASNTYELPQAYLEQGGLPAPYAAGNTENVLKAMRAKGYGPDKVSWLGFNGLVTGKNTIMSHGAGFVPSAVMAAEFFRGKTPLQNLPHLPDPK